MITIKSQREIAGMSASGALLADVHRALRSFIKPGLTTFDVDRFAEKYIVDHGGYPAQKGYEGYPYATCVSVNNEICHGFPTKTVLKKGDLLKVDMCVDLHGFLSDSCWSYLVGNEGDDATKQLMDVTRQAMYLGIEQAKIDNHVGDIGAVMDEYVKSFGYQMCQMYTGHGLGPTIHEDPSVPFTGTKGKGVRLKEGMVITVEPIVNVDTPYCTVDKNGWTSRTLRGGLSCQYEHSLAITKDGPLVMTSQGDQ